MIVRTPPSDLRTRTRWHALAFEPHLALVIELEGALLGPASVEDSLDLNAVLQLVQFSQLGIHVFVMSDHSPAEIEEMRQLVPSAWWAARGGERWWYPVLAASDDGTARRAFVTPTSWVRANLPDVRILVVADRASHECFAELAPEDAAVAVGRPQEPDRAFVSDSSSVRAFLRWIAETRRGRDLPLLVMTT